MQTLRNATNAQGFQTLVNTLYDLPMVQGFALGVHGNFVSLYRAEFGGNESIDEILNSGRAPAAWHQACGAAKLPTNLSPIYVVVYVTMSPDDFRTRYAVPAVALPDLLVVIEQITPFEATSDRTRHRPTIRGGISVGNAALATAGTLGGFLKESSAGAPLILSCNHVLEDGSSTDVLQQGAPDGGTTPSDTVGSTRWVVLISAPTGFTFTSPFNTVDAALAEVKCGVLADRVIRTLKGPVNRLATIAAIQLDDEVVFVGKESDYQEAKVFRYLARVKVTINGTTYNFGDVFEIESRLHIYVGHLVHRGDSGAWVVAERIEEGSTSYALYGTVFARSGKTGLCCFVENVLDELNGLASGSTSFDLY